MHIHRNYCSIVLVINAPPLASKRYCKLKSLNCHLLYLQQTIYCEERLAFPSYVRKTMLLLDPACGFGKGYMLESREIIIIYTLRVQLEEETCLFLNGKCVSLKLVTEELQLLCANLAWPKPMFGWVRGRYGGK